MKLISWNVNGLRAAWNHGASDFLEKCDADIISIQETRIETPYEVAELPGYYPFWSFCKTTKGYSGTLCLSKYAPLDVCTDLDDPEFDTEGRIITLEFEGMYVVNVYFPNSQRSGCRRDYRNEWDERFTRYVMELQSCKPVILCGDFNTTVSGEDVYEGNPRAEWDNEGFQSPERESLHGLLANGFTDTYRLVHPDEKGKFTWWSRRLFKRHENRGWRLDYFLVSDTLKDRVRESTMLTEIYASDHCPILLEADIACRGQQGVPTHRYTCPGTPQNTRNIISEHTRNRELAALWEDVNWEGTLQHLHEMQHSLTMAAYAHDMESIAKWQKRIVRSLDCRLLAVRKVCSREAGPGVDGIRWKTSHEKMRAALALSSREYHAMPSRLIVMNCKNGKKRRIHVETYYDRAMQQLFAYSLDPVAEAWGDRKSFAYREGRSAYDLNEYIKEALSGNGAPGWLFIGDVRQCYEHISHEWIMNNIPMEKRVLRQFLKAGFVFGGQLYPMQKGVGIGCTISPIVANMTLDGLQRHIYSRLYPDKKNIDYADGDMIRYADDILVFARTEETALRIKSYVTEFLEERGLMLSPEKSRVIPASQGFSFMGRTYYKAGIRMLARPSDESTERFMAQVRDLIEAYTGSQRTLIAKLNRKIDGWTAFHKTDEAMEAFRKMDVYITAMLMKLCESKHPKWSREKIIQKYWYAEAGGRYCYALPDKKEIRVKFLEDTQLIYYEAVRSSINPYVLDDYLEKRRKIQKINNVVGVYRSVWNRQDGRCHYCGCKMLRDDDKTLVEVHPEKKNFAARMAYVHTRCLSSSLEYIDTAEPPASVNDVRALLLMLEAGNKPGGKRHRLYEFFRTCDKESFSMTFKEIEDVMGEPLGASASRKQFWQRTGFLSISQCWLMNGYRIARLHLRDQRVDFARVTKTNDTAEIHIPHQILHTPVPLDAKYELENYFRYIIKKFGL